MPYNYNYIVLLHVCFTTNIMRTTSEIQKNHIFVFQIELNPTTMNHPPTISTLHYNIMTRYKVRQRQKASLKALLPWWGHRWCKCELQRWWWWSFGSVLGSAWVGWETIKELEHISIGRKTNISNTSNIHNLSQRRAVTLLLGAPTIWSISS